MEKLDNLLVPKEEIQEEPETKEEAMDCTEDTKEGAKEEKVSNKTIKFGKTDEEYEEKLASGGDGPSSSSKKNVFSFGLSHCISTKYPSEVDPKPKII